MQVQDQTDILELLLHLLEDTMDVLSKSTFIVTKPLRLVKWLSFCSFDSDTGSFTFEDENPSKHYNFAYGSKAACPTNYKPPPGPNPSEKKGKKHIAIP